MNWEKTRNTFLVVLVLAVCMALPGLAQEREGGMVFAVDPNPAPAAPNGVGTELVADGGFEAGTPNPNWTETSTNFGTPICDVPSCGTGTGTGPYAGAFWAWFGGIAAAETGSVSQTIAGGANDSCQLTFWLEIPVSSGNGTDFLNVTIDDNLVYSADEADGPFVGYTQISVDVSGEINGSDQILEFNSTITGSPGLSNFFVDDVSLICTAGPVPTMPSWALVLLVMALISAGVLVARLRLS